MFDFSSRSGHRYPIVKQLSAPPLPLYPAEELPMRHPGSVLRTAKLLVIVLVAASSFAVAGAAGGEGDPSLGVPSSVTIGPEAPPLKGRRATRQLIVSARYADGKVRDLT